MNLSFRLGKIPVQIHPTFLILAAILGFTGGRFDAQAVTALVSWVVIVFVSVMLHELGHATTGIAFGLQPRIDLHGMGGTTSWATPKALATSQRIAISLAGPFAGFLVGGAVIGLEVAGLIPNTDFWVGIVGTILWVNVGWGIFNLLPMLPLDGGNVLLQVLHAFTRGRGERAARIVSIVVAGLALGLGLLLKSGYWGVMLGLMFIGTNVQGLQALREREHDAPMHDSLKEAYAALESNDAQRVLELARPVALGSKTPQVRAEALQLLAFGFLLEGRVADADAAIAALPRGYAPHPRLLELRASAVGRA